jgi:predicted transcriptional regulator
MRNDNTKKNYIVPLGEFRAEVDQEKVDPAWQLIHKLRVQHGLSITEFGQLAGGSGSSVSKGERGGIVSLAITRRALQMFGYDLNIVSKGEMTDD